MATIPEVIEAGHAYNRRFKQPLTLAGIGMADPKIADRVKQAIEQAIEAGTPYPDHQTFMNAAGNPRATDHTLPPHNIVPVVWPTIP